MEDVTPIRKQYLRLKAQHPDAILFFRLGDFYETFDADAEIVARELDIVLTSRPVAKGVRVPMAGVPHHAVENYIARLIEKGYRVAIAEQVGEVTGKGLVEREVVRVVTPGTVVEPTLLDARRPNYLAALVIEEDRAGLAYAEITTGEFATTQLAREEVPRELARLQPRECLFPDAREWKSSSPLPPRGGGVGSGDLPSFIYGGGGLPGIHFTPYPFYRFELGTARQTLLDHFGVATLEGFGCEGKPLAIRAAGAILQYLRETQKSALAQLTTLRTYSTDRFLVMDPTTRRNLELTESLRERRVQGSLLGVLDRTLTPMGARLLRARITQPLVDRKEIERRLDEVEAFVQDGILRARVREALKDMPDLERLVNRVLGSIATPRDLVGIRRALEAVEALTPTPAASGGFLLLSRFAGEGGEGRGEGVRAIADLIARAIVDDPPASLSEGGVIRPGFSEELDSLLRSVREAREWLASLERREQERTGIKNLKVGYNKVFGYYIEVTKANLHAVPPDYIRKQTLVGAERFITPELKEVEALILNAQERQVEVETRVFREVCAHIAARAPMLLETARWVARLDVAAALAEVAVRNRYVRPELTDENVLEIVGGRHPVVEQTLSEPFVPNDLYLDEETRILIITGPNMAGKSVYIRQNALIVLMAQMGSFVPAERARIGIVDRIFARIGAQDEVAAGQSTFMVEMVETANILNNATPRSLVILDEVGRGTSTYDGISIAWAVVEYLHNHPGRRARTLFATHYHELTELANRLPGVKNVNLAVAEEGGQIVFLHKVVPGGADRSYGIHVAQLAGVPRSVISRAQELLEALESGKFRPGTPAPKPYQPPLFADEHPVVEELRKLDIAQMTPLEAINKLYELQQKVGGTAPKRRGR
ncbi:MAG: DNA mismatch repair protein MutS [Anaerolineae bacterium]|nr:DNA mismatch repair protein MutS [Anaerolineae bacterium]